MSTLAHLLCRRQTVVWLLAILLLASSVRAEDPLLPKPGAEPLPDNFGRMEDWLYRGAAPDPEQLRSLAGLGVNTVIDLRHPAERGYGIQVRQLGMEYIRIPLRPRSVPSEDQLQRFLSLLDNEENRPVYVHCRKGRHRTGLLLALYRVLRQGESPEAALEEMQAYGFGRGHRRMVASFQRRTAGSGNAPGRTGDRNLDY